MKLIDVAIFIFPNDAAILESILLGEKIEYFLNNQAMSTYVMGSGVTLSVREEDVDRVVEIIKEAGFEKNLIPRD
jgi:phosphoribosylaminoimidazole (AIR) synthetase